MSVNWKAKDICGGMVAGYPDPYGKGISRSHILVGYDPYASSHKYYVISLMDGAIISRNMNVVECVNFLNSIDAIPVKTKVDVG